MWSSKIDDSLKNNQFKSHDICQMDGWLSHSLSATTENVWVKTTELFFFLCSLFPGFSALWLLNDYFCSVFDVFRISSSQLTLKITFLCPRVSWKQKKREKKKKETRVNEFGGDQLDLCCGSVLLLGQSFFKVSHEVFMLMLPGALFVFVTIFSLSFKGLIGLYHSIHLHL